MHVLLLEYAGYGGAGIRGVHPGSASVAALSPVLGSYEQPVNTATGGLARS